MISKANIQKLLLQNQFFGVTLTSLGQKPKSGFYTSQSWLNCATATQSSHYFLGQNMFTRCMRVFWEKIQSDMRWIQYTLFKVLQWQVPLQWHVDNCTANEARWIKRVQKLRSTVCDADAHLLALIMGHPRSWDMQAWAKLWKSRQVPATMLESIVYVPMVNVEHIWCERIVVFEICQTQGGEKWKCQNLQNWIHESQQCESRAVGNAESVPMNHSEQP